MDIGTEEPARVTRYDGRSMLLHWVTALLVVLLWCAGQTIDWFPSGAPRVYARSVHITAGAILGLILLYRIWWRSSVAPELRPLGSGFWPRLAGAVHLLLYLGLFAVVILGMANAWVRGDNLFYWFTVHPLDPGNSSLRKTVAKFHELAANGLLILAGAHALAGIMHSWQTKDETLQRMLPARHPVSSRN